MQLASPGPGFQLALVQFQGRMRRGLKLFRKITGPTAVTSLATSLPEPGRRFALSPPVRPQCARRLRSVRSASCGEQRLIHLRSGRRSRRPHSHTCPIGMRCTCVPIHFGDHLVGVAKRVADPGTSDSAFSAVIAVLTLVVSETSRDSVVSLLSEELRALRQRVADYQRIQTGGSPGAAGSDPRLGPPGANDPEDRAVALVDRALVYLREH